MTSFNSRLGNELSKTQRVINLFNRNSDKDFRLTELVEKTTINNISLRKILQFLLYNDIITKTKTSQSITYRYNQYGK